MPGQIWPGTAPGRAAAPLVPTAAVAVLLPSRLNRPILETGTSPTGSHQQNHQPQRNQAFDCQPEPKFMPISGPKRDDTCPTSHCVSSERDRQELKPERNSQQDGFNGDGGFA
jgi:hypothetical protein